MREKRMVEIQHLVVVKVACSVTGGYKEKKSSVPLKRGTEVNKERIIM